MFNRQGITTRTLLRQTAVAAQAQSPALETERPGNEHIRMLLKSFGLRTSFGQAQGARRANGLE